MPVESDVLRLGRAREGEWRRVVIEAGGITLPGPLPRPTNPTDLFNTADLIFVPASPPRSRRQRWQRARIAQQRAVMAPSIDLLGRTTRRSFHATRGELQVRLGYREAVEYRYPSTFRRPLVTGRPIGWFAQGVTRHPVSRRAWRVERWPSSFFQSYWRTYGAARAFFGPPAPRARAPWRSCAYPCVFAHLRLIGEGDRSPSLGEVV